ncbi:MAG: hypothetical protein HY22_06080 [[Candidatus Thermochlorobacteriaceae] bacterium GBChlB]|jgi:hypothetical protein|nr:MAG: hypothetical protein HY22_06080 [[Candidatus Thermochlorobacteriaceae] bacterium GBChlB]
MKKQKCESCFRTKPESAFIEERGGRKVVYDTCSECRALEARARRKQQERVVLRYAKALGILKNDRATRQSLL